MKKKILNFRTAMVLVSLALVGIDQLTKWLAVTYVKPVGSIPIVKFGDTEWINFTYCENTGMSFSLLEGQRFILIAVPIILIALVEWYIFSGRATDKKMIFALACLAGGGFGNLIDRVFLGYVVDFIDFRIINFAIFNFADICAVLGGIAVAIMVVVEENKAEKAKKLAEESEAESKDENS